VFLDQVAMNDAERWMEIAETMTLEAAFGVETNAAPIEQTEVTETVEQAETVEAAEQEMIEAVPEPRARALSITQLRQKLGIEEVAAPPARTRAPEPMAGGPPRIVSRRRDMAMQEPELMAG
jgi:hypothetical protein